MKSIIELAKEAGLGDMGVRGDFIFYQPGVDGLVRFSKTLLDHAIRAALDECPTPDGALCAEAIAALRERLGEKT